jgi:hypothetical protein
MVGWLKGFIRDGGSPMVRASARARVIGRVITCAALAASIGGTALAVSRIPVGAESTTFDVRGSWDEVSVVDSARFPQTTTFTTEDFSTGAVSGTEAGGGSNSTVTGTVLGSTVTTDATRVGASYTSHAVGTLAYQDDVLTISGTFSDSNGGVGTFNGRLTHPAVAAPPAEKGLPVALLALLGSLAALIVVAAPIAAQTTQPGGAVRAGRG